MVMLVVGILSAVATVALGRTDASRSRLAAQQLHRDLSFARQHAVATGLGVWVVLDDGAETWAVLEEDPASPGRAGASVITDPATGADFVIALGATPFAGVEIVSADFDGGAEVGFNWLGEPLNDGGAALAAQGSVSLSDGHGITVEIGTGYVAHVAP